MEGFCEGSIYDLCIGGVVFVILLAIVIREIGKAEKKREAEKAAWEEWLDRDTSDRPPVE